MEGEDSTKERMEEAKKEAEIASVENELRDLMNFVKVKNTEELKPGEGKKIEDDTANELVEKIKQIALKLGISSM
ncbi:MAG: hypothetical protein IB618_00575 [Candidatus Pacearchaeota archaeon]|nr:MAG: hypothetical protein IB618_00575 [Candidatus Pacearchaeota archaeon]